MTATLAAVAFDCADAARLAGFWSQVLDRPVDDGATEGFAAIGMGVPQGLGWMFLKVPEGKTAKNRVHVDLSVADLAAETARLVALGATHVADHEEGNVRWSTLRDPEGNEFDLAAS